MLSLKWLMLCKNVHLFVHKKQKIRKGCVWCLKAVLPPSDALCGWDQAEWRSGSLEWSCSLLLPRGGPGGHWGIPAGALAGGPACSLTYDHDGPTNTHTLPPRYQDHRLAWWWWWRSTCESIMVFLISSGWPDHVSAFPQKITGQVSMHISGTTVPTLQTRNTKSWCHIWPGRVLMTASGWV